MAQWYCNIQGQQYGPAELTTLQQWARDGRLTAADLVWTDGMPDWQPAGSVPQITGAPVGVFCAGL